MGLQIEEQKNLIEKCIKSNAKFNGNEDLFEDFFNEAYKKSYIIFNSSYPIKKIESYVQKVVNTSIVGVLKDLGRIKRTSSGYIKNTEVSLDNIQDKEYATVSLKSAERDVFKEYLYEIEDPKDGIEEQVIRKDLLRRIADIVCIIHSENPTKCYYEIFVARYVRNMKQSEIAKTLNISQSEISKRLIELSTLIKIRIKT